MNLKCYFAHAGTTCNSDEKIRLVEILEDRGLEVIDPFDDEEKILRKHGCKGKWFYDDPKYSAGREIWIKDLSQVREANLLLAWFSTGIHRYIGISAELMYGLEYQKRIRFDNNTKPTERQTPFLIQIISEIKHPLIAYALQYGNQKNFIFIKNKLHLNKKYVLFGNEIILKDIFNNKNEKSQEKGIKRLISFNMTIQDLEKIIKLNKIEKNNEYKKAYTTKNKNKYKKMYQKIYEQDQI